MRRPAVFLALLLAALLLPGGCGGGGLRGEVIELLERRSGEVDSISYTCVTEDAGRLYRERFELRFPDDYRYSFYEVAEGRERLLAHTAQRGNDIWRARLAQGGEGEAASLRVEMLSRVPPLRCTGTYLALYHLVGNGDYYQSLVSLIEGGELVVAGAEEAEGRAGFRLESADGLSPRLRIWLDRETGLPLRKEMALGGERTVVFRYEDVVEDRGYEEGPFPPHAATLFGAPGEDVETERRDGACLPVDVAVAAAEVGFTPLLPDLEGFELAAACVCDPAASTLSASQEPLRFPAGFRELYLVLRSGSRQVEIRQSPRDPQFSHHTTGLGALTGACLTGRRTFGEEAGGAFYAAAVDCQEMHLTLDKVEIMVTGDLSRGEFEALAVQLRELARSRPAP